MQTEILETMERSNQDFREENREEKDEQREEIDILSIKDMALKAEEDTKAEMQEEAINPQVFEFLDLYTMEERLDYLKHTMEWKDITEKDLDIMAVSVDIVLKENEISAKIDDLIYCVEQLAQWEINGKRR